MSKIIRIRRGQSEDFREDLMLSGEFAVDVDTGAVHVCYQDGKCNTLADAEAVNTAQTTADSAAAAAAQNASDIAALNSLVNPSSFTVLSGSGYGLLRSGRVYILRLNGYTGTIDALQTALTDYLPVYAARGMVVDSSQKTVFVLSLISGSVRCMQCIGAYTDVTPTSLYGQVVWFK